MYVFVFAFNRGSFHARHIPSEPTEPRWGLIADTVPPVEIGWLGGTLAKVQVSAFALDFASIPPRSVQAAVAYDGLLFVDPTRAAIPTPTGRRLPPGKRAQGAP